MHSPPQSTLRKVRWLLAIFMAGLLVSGLTATPLVAEVDALVKLTGAKAATDQAPRNWLLRVQLALHNTEADQPILFYGTDWLAFGHVVIALAFVGAWRDPVRNAWLFDFGLIACALVIPWSWCFGHLREIPVWWRLIDCSFGVLGAMPLLFCKHLLHEFPSPA